MTERKRLTKEQRQKLHDMFGCRCAYCGCAILLNEMQADHVVPLALGGADDMSNLFPSCRSCNHRKSTETVEVFRDTVARWCDVLMRDSVTYKNAVRFGQVLPNPHPVVFYFESVGLGKDGAK